jgi:hypothetical protein
MPLTRLERERPAEWLRRLAEEPLACEVLVASAGGLAAAAYRVARARCRMQGHGETPTLRELQLAALSLARQIGTVESLPIATLLASDCEEQGMLVIRPITVTPPPSAPSDGSPLQRAS